MELKKGDKVRVIECVNDHKIIEGIGTLITPIFTKGTEREKWEVQFNDHPGRPIVYRFVTVGNKI